MKRPKLFEPHYDPVTRERLSAGEYVSLRASQLIRNWKAFLFFQAITAVWWAIGKGLDWWNYAWSDLAIVVEQALGIALFSLSRRDSAVIRRLVSLEEDIAKALSHQQQVLANQQEVLSRLTSLEERVLSDLEGPGRPSSLPDE
jgi:hypothetical protein